MAHGHKQFGRYELVTEIGRGGMAELHLGRLLGIGGFAKPVAIKRILPHLSVDPRFVEMFLNEGRIAARLSHPNVCQVYELGEVEGELFLAMEYLEGVPWGELLESGKHAPTEILQLAAYVIGQACDGLSYAHELHSPKGEPTPIVHRDISPGNLYVTVDGVCKILDFGVSKMVSQGHDTRGGMIKGKLTYMPPEQMRGDHVDARADVFAAGVVLWEAFTGQRLFIRDSDYLIFKAILEDPIPPIAQFDARYVQFGDAIDVVIGRALERDRDQRYPTIRAFADALRAVAAQHGDPVTAADVGTLVRTRFHRRLADRSRMVAAASNLHERLKIDVDPESSVTTSMKLRGAGPLAIERGRSRRSGWTIAIVAATVLAAVAIVSPQERDDVDSSVRTPNVGTVAVTAAAIAPAAAIDPAPPENVDMEPRTPGSNVIRARQRSRRDAAVVSAVAKNPGYYSVDSKPYATIFVDGERRDQTPVFRVALAPGRHQIRAVLNNGRHRTFTVRIAPGAEVSSGTLSW